MHSVQSKGVTKAEKSDAKFNRYGEILLDTLAKHFCTMLIKKPSAGVECHEASNFARAPWLAYKEIMVFSFWRQHDSDCIVAEIQISMTGSHLVQQT